ncbi:MAG: VanZ family protein [Rikenellaceae bacterium]
MESLKRKIGIVYLLALSLLLLIAIPLEGGSEGVNDTYVIGLRGDYLIHAVIYLPWMLLCSEKFTSLWFVVGIMTAAVLEFLQMLLPYRSFNINDLIAGVLGVSLSLPLALMLRKVRNK